MLMNESCTVYLRNGCGFDRYYIPNCHWQESRASNVLKSGMTDADGITVYILKKAAVIFPNGELHPCNELFPDMHIAPKSPARDMMVFGECEFTFDNLSEQSVSESLKRFVSEYDAHTVMSIDRLLYGSEDMQHYKISAR